jgi:hypothetical protein
LALLDRGQCHPLEQLGGDGTALADTLDGKQPPVGGASLSLQLVEVAQPTLAAEVGGW